MDLGFQEILMEAMTGRMSGVEGVDVCSVVIEQGSGRPGRRLKQ